MRHNVANVPAKRAPKNKSERGRPISNTAVIQLSLLDVIVADSNVDDAVKASVAKKLRSIEADTMLRAAHKIVADEHLKAALEYAAAKKAESIEADIAAHRALVNHINRLRDFNVTVAA